MTKNNLLKASTVSMMLRSERGAAHTPHEGEDGVFRSYSILANTVTPLCAPVSPYHFKDVLI